MVFTTQTPSPTPAPGTAVDRRIELIELAVELEVDREDFVFATRAEELLWDELTEEFEQRNERLGRVWLAG